MDHGHIYKCGPWYMCTFSSRFIHFQEQTPPRLVPTITDAQGLVDRIYIIYYIICHNLSYHLYCGLYIHVTTILTLRTSHCSDMQYTCNFKKFHCLKGLWHDLGSKILFIFFCIKWFIGAF